MIDSSAGCDNNETCDTVINKQLQDLLISDKRYVLLVITDFLKTIYTLNLYKKKEFSYLKVMERYYFSLPFVECPEIYTTDVFEDRKSVFQVRNQLIAGNLFLIFIPQKFRYIIQGQGTRILSNISKLRISLKPLPRFSLHTSKPILIPKLTNTYLPLGYLYKIKCQIFSNYILILPLSKSYIKYRCHI